MPFLCWLMLTVTELNQSLTYIVIICTNVPHPSQSQINCLGMIYQSKRIVPLGLSSHIQLVHLILSVPRAQQLIMTMLKMPGKEHEFRPLIKRRCS